MSQVTEMDSYLDGIGHVLADKRLAVPRYQRPYAWTQKHANDLYIDIADAMSRGEPEYFLGSIVTIGSGAERLEVVDGQQRLATVTILLAAIRDYFYTSGDQNRASDVEIDYLFRRHTRTQEVIPYLQLNETDHEFFRRRVLTRPDNPDRAGLVLSRESFKRIDEAAALAADRVQVIAKGTNDPTEKLLDWADYLRDKAKIIVVRVRDDANAFTIFETLNDRGLALAITDLIKNMLFSRARHRIEEVQQRWMVVTGVLEPLGDEDIVLNFIRHYWLSLHGVTRKDDLFLSIRKQINGVQPVVDFADALQRNAPLYEAIVSPDVNTWNRFSEDALGYMNLLNLLGMVQIRPLLLAMMDKFPEAEVNNAMKYAVSWSVRFLTVGGLGGGTLENHYSGRARDIRDGVITTARQLRDVMRKQVPGDAQFRSAFEVATISRSPMARYYLRVLEGIATGDTNPPLVISTSVKAVNLEHVLPQNPSADWSHIDPDTAKAMYNRLGNLALMGTSLNKAVQNSGFKTKAPEYKKSPFRLTSEISHESAWGKAEIEARQKRLANLAVAAWPL